MTRWTSSIARTFVGATAALALVGLSTAEAQIGTLSNTATVTLTATKAATIKLTTGSSALTLAGGITDKATNQFPALTYTLDWTLTAGSSLQLVGWFGSATQAMANGTNYIPTTYIEGKQTSSPTWNTFTNNAVGGVGAAGSSLVLDNVALTAANYTATKTSSIDLRLNLTSAPNTVAGDYTGTLNLRAVVQ